MDTKLSMTTEADENFETYSLLWLDAAVNDSNQNLQAQKKLRQTINHLKTFEDVLVCLLVSLIGERSNCFNCEWKIRKINRSKDCSFKTNYLHLCLLLRFTNTPTMGQTIFEGMDILLVKSKFVLFSL